MNDALSRPAPGRSVVAGAGRQGWVFIYGLAIVVGAGAGALFGLALTA